MKKGIIFDFDGTLCDSKEFWTHLASTYLKDCGIIDHNIDDECKNFTLAEAANHIKEKHKLDKTINFIMMELNCLIEEAYLKDVKLKDGVIDFIEFLGIKDYKMIIATDTPKPLVNAVLKRYNVLNYIVDVITTIKVKKSKEFPDIYDYCLLRLDLEKKDVIVFEDNALVIKMLSENSYDTIYFKNDSEDCPYAFDYIESFKDDKVYNILEKII